MPSPQEAAGEAGLQPAPRSTAPATARFTLYSRSYCHLCDDMLAGLHALAGVQPIAVDVIDIDADPALVLRFDELVPVLFGADLEAPELCHYFLDAEAVRASLVAQCGR
jgi:hypothetical protein